MTSSTGSALALSRSGGTWNSRPLPFLARVCLAFEVYAAYAAILRLRMSRTQLPSLVRELRARQGPGVDGAGSGVSLEHDLSARLGFIVQMLLARVPRDGPCLMRSLVLTKLLARREIPSRMVIGVRSEPSFSAHAWVEHFGAAVLPTDDTYARLVEL